MIKINKRKCFEFAIPDRKFPSDNGILHAKQIHYIVTTAVKTINHHRTLVLYIYLRKQAARGDCKPLWTMFHLKEDFLTIERREDGSTAWRTASFDRLDRNTYNFSSQCAFYSNQDERRVQRYFKADADTDGFQTLSDTQETILAHRRQERQLTKEKAIVARMAGIPALPRDLKSWIKSIMPAYFFYDYKRSKNTSGICSACGREVTLLGIKQGGKAICPHCKHELTAKPRSRRGNSMYDRETFEIIQNMGDGRLVIRVIKAYYSYATDTPKVNICENARQFIWRDASGNICTEHYYYSRNSGIITDWKKGTRPVFFMYQYHFEGDTCGHLYTKNLSEAFSNTPWQYCTIADFYHHFCERMQALPFLAAHIEHPRLEHLCKVGFYDLVSDLVYHNDGKMLDETQNRTHKILGVAAEDVAFLRDIDTDLATLKIFQRYACIKDRQHLLKWQLEYKVNRDILEILHYMTVHKFTQYMDKQYAFLRLRKTPHKTQRYNVMQDLVSEYRDYLGMCNKLNYDVKRNSVLFPKDIQKFHDKTARRLKHKTDAETKQEFITIYKSISKQLCFEKDGLKLICPSVPEDVIAEGFYLSHCVGDYIGRITGRECIILFIRKSCKIDKPYYTMEIRGKEIVQVRGIGNCSMTPEVKDFVDCWKRQVLQRVADNAA